MTGLSKIVDVAVGHEHACALDEANDVWRLTLSDGRRLSARGAQCAANQIEDDALGLVDRLRGQIFVLVRGAEVRQNFGVDGVGLGEDAQGLGVVGQHRRLDRGGDLGEGVYVTLAWAGGGNSPGVRLAGPPKVVGHSGLRLRLATTTGELGAIGWDLAHRARELDVHTPIDIAFRLERDEWNGESRLQAKLADFRPAQG